MAKAMVYTIAFYIKDKSVYIVLLCKIRYNKRTKYFSIRGIMETKYIYLKNTSKYEELKEISKEIKKGKLVVFPTETVYGLGANALDEKAVAGIFTAKGRNNDNPLIVHISDIKMLDQLVTEVGTIEKKLINAFWPGPLTIIFHKKKIVPYNVTAGLETVGIRMPKHPIALKLIEYADCPIAAPSANISGKPSGTNIEDIKEELWNKVDYIIDAGMTDIGIESTVIQVIKNKINILRPGKITAEDLREFADVAMDKHIFEKAKEGEKVKSPGMKYRHYAPNTKCVLVYSENEEKLIDKANELAADNEVLILCKNKNLNAYDVQHKLGMGNTLEEISKNIFTLLRKVDSYHVNLVIIEGVEKEGLGLAIMNRLLRACEYHYIEV